MREDILIEEIQGRLLRRCGLTSVSKIKDGVLHLFIADILHLGYIRDTLSKDVEQVWCLILEDMSKNWIRLSAPHTMQKEIEALK